MFPALRTEQFTIARFFILSLELRKFSFKSPKIFYASLSLCSFSDKGVRSGVGLGMAGCLLVTLAGVAGLGCSMMLNVPFNAATTQIVPFLTLGLGVDDMFLLVHSYRDIVRVARKDEIGFLLKETGLSALLTSINNILAFLAGGFLPVPALRDFCLQVALLLTFNAISILTIYPAMMNIDLLRRKNRRVDNRDGMATGSNTDLAKMRSNSAILRTNEQENGKLNSGDDSNCGNIYRNESCLTVNNYDTMNSTMSYSQNCLTAPIDDSSVQGTLAGGATILSKPEFESGYSCKHMTLHRFVSDVYNVWLSKTPVKIGVLMFNGILLASGLVGCSRIVLGLELTDVIPRGTAAYAFLDARERFFSFYPFNGIIKGPIDLPSKQALIYEYREKLGDVKYVVKQDGKVQEQFWLDLMRVWLQQLQQHFDDNIAQDKLIANLDKNTGISKDASEEAILAYKLLCNAGSVLNCSRINTYEYKRDGRGDNHSQALRESKQRKGLARWEATSTLLEFKNLKIFPALLVEKFFFGRLRPCEYGTF
uniref:SSD domain-containing protein n=1 Tax=Romanomermis culicivorax TaxID=13658 RepID=A0A915HN68_ROMCU